MRENFFDEQLKYEKDKRNVITANGCPQSNLAFGYLGDMAAEGEWNKNKDLAKHMFLHTDAYHEFLNDDSLILLGRTGVGKTAILLSAKEYMIENENTSQENSVVLNVDSTELLISLTNCIELTTFNQATVSLEIQRIIQMFVETAIMQEIVLNFNHSTACIKNMKRYLETSGLIKKSEWKTFISTFLEEMESVNIKNENVDQTKDVIMSMYKITQKLKSIGFNEAKVEMTEFLNENGRAVVLIDSLDHYNVNNKEMVLIVKGLIETCFYYFRNFDSKILLKIALPSEIYNKVLIRLAAKERGNTVVIRWTYKELVIFLALRIYAKYKSGDLSVFKFCENFEDYSSFYEDINPEAYNNSIKLISNFLPEICPTSLNFPFMTLPYCLRHTLKKPREVLAMFNTIIDIIIKQNDAFYFVKNPEKIKDAIHMTQEYMISSALSMYASTYVSIYAACQSLLNGKFFVFKGKDLNGDIKKAIVAAKKHEDQLRTTNEYMDNSEMCYLDEAELKRILLESGLVGKIEKGSIINENNIKLNNKEKICVLSANFDFRISATAANYMFFDDAQYVFHPMCYENYYFKLDKNTLVYPSGDDDGDVLIETIITSNS